MNAVFLDTSGAIALLHSGDTHHDKARALATRFRGERRPRLTTTAVLSELGDGFVRKKRWEVLDSFLAAFFNDALVTVVAVDRDLLERARQLRNARPDKDWGMTDCLSFVVMTDHGIQEAFTADHHFQQAGFRALLLEEQTD
jgi:uncharacterized protein